MFDISGTVKKIFPEQTFGSGFNKREFVLTTDAERFPQDLKFECVKDKVSLLADLEAGARVKVFFDLRGREWKENYYVNLNAWKLEPLDDAAEPEGDERPLSEPDGLTPIDDEPPF